MNLSPVFADVVLRSGGADGGGLVQLLLYALLIGICVGLIWWVGTWFISKLGGPPMAMTIWNGLFILIGLIIVINFLLGLGGRSFIHW